MERPSEPAEPRCSSCGKVTAEGAFCEHCGTPLAAVPAERPRRGAERSKAAFELHRARQILAGVRGLFWLFAIFGVVVWVIGWAASMRQDAGDEVAAWPWLLAALGGLMAVVGVAGALRATKEPLLWGVTLGVLVTTELALRLVLGATPFQYTMSGLFTLFAWSSVPMLAKAQRLLREHSDLRIAQQMLGTYQRRAVEQSEIRGRLRERDSAGRRRVLWRVAIGAALCVTVLVVTVILTRPGRAGGERAFAGERGQAKPPALPVEPSVAAFDAAWNGNDTAAIRDLYGPDEREKAWAATQRFLDRRGWSQKLPRLGKAELDRKAPDKVLAVYDVEGHELRVWWRGDERGWRLGSFGYEK